MTRRELTESVELSAHRLRHVEKRSTPHEKTILEPMQQPMPPRNRRPEVQGQGQLRDTKFFESENF